MIQKDPYTGSFRRIHAQGVSEGSTQVDSERSIPRIIQKDSNTG
jgi:hypothetical protein